MTPYSDVYKAFLGEIQDDFYLHAEGDIIENDLNLLLNKAIVHFSYPKVDVRNKNDMLQQFNVDLDVDEIEILATGMVLAWVERELHSVDMLRQSMTTKDFNTYSQAPHINAIARTSERSEKKLKKMLIKYSIRNKDGSVGFKDLG